MTSGGCLCTWKWVMLLLSRCSEQGGGYSEWEWRGSWEQHPGHLAAPSTCLMAPILHHLLTWIWCLFLEIIVQILVSSFSNSFHVWGQVSQRPGGENWTGEEASLSPGSSRVCTSTSPQEPSFNFPAWVPNCFSIFVRENLSPESSILRTPN